jgi:glutamate-1-semialdehyde 2,1-aminomutase
MLPGGVLSALRAQPDRRLVRGRGGRCWDQYGLEYVDFICGYGPISVGHANDEINSAVYEQLKKGIIFPASGPAQEALQSELYDLFPYAKNSIFLKTGSEAVLAAVRLARAATGKSKIVRCGFHGWHDGFISPYTSWHMYEPDDQAPRLIPGVYHGSFESLILSWDGKDIQKLADLFHGYSSDIAAFILDPIQLREPLDENLQHIRELTTEKGVVFILDEIKTGFRVSMQGVQGLYNIQADLAVFSKAIANGFPLAVVIGKEEFMRWLPQTRIMGTYNNELVSIAAAIATLSILKRPGNIDWLWKVGQMLIDGINAILGQHHLVDHMSAVPYRWPCLPALWFHQHSKLGQNLLPSLQAAWAMEGLLFLPNHPNFTCVEHTEQDVNKALQHFEVAITRCLSKAG